MNSLIAACTSITQWRG